MAQLWGGRFTKETDRLVYNFNASITFDRKLYRQDIRGSLAHVKMLAKQGILTQEEGSRIEEGLKGILEDVENGTLPITEEYEDIHSFVEANLIDRIGDVGKKLHTGRSRNDQVALDMKLYVRDEIGELETRTASQQEIREFGEQLERFGITFSDVADNCPRQERTLAACHRVLDHARSHPELLERLVKSGRLPINELAAGSGADKKTLERHRKYLVAILLAFTNGYEIIRGHLCRLAPAKGGSAT